MKRNATAVWQGSGKDGNGKLTTQSNVLNGTPYAFNTRFENEQGTNPEELIAAAHAGCFTMQLAFNIDKAGFKATALDTTCTITFEGGAVTQSHLSLKAEVEGISAEKFNEVVKDAEKNCPISKLLNTAISVDTSLNA